MRIMSEYLIGVLLERGVGGCRWTKGLGGGLTMFSVRRGRGSNLILTVLGVLIINSCFVSV